MLEIATRIQRTGDALWKRASERSLGRSVLERLGWDSHRFKRYYLRKRYGGSTLPAESDVDGYFDEGETWRVKALMDAIAEKIGTPQSVLDVGCGTGRYLRHWADVAPDARLVGIDLAPETLSQFTRTAVPKAELAVVDIERDQRFWRTHQDQFDLVSLIAIAQIIAVRRLPSVLRKLAAMSRPGGAAYLQFCTPTPDKPSTLGFRRYAVDELVRACEDAGLIVTDAGPIEVLRDYGYVLARKSER